MRLFEVCRTNFWAGQLRDGLTPDKPIIPSIVFIAINQIRLPNSYKNEEIVSSNFKTPSNLPRVVLVVTMAAVLIANGC